MLRFEMDGKNRTLESTGTLMDTIYGCSTLIRDLYFSMMRNDPDMAMTFRKAMEILMTDRESPMWDESKRPSPQIEIFIPRPGKKE